MKLQESEDSLYFYHSFPRRKSGDKENKKAFDILESIFSIGLLATPEQFDWTELRKDGTSFLPWTIRQLTTCFTVLPRSEIGGHGKVFGNFSLEFELGTLRRFGILPVFYLPTTEDPNDLSSISGSIVGRIGDITKLLGRMVDFTKIAASRPADPISIDIVETGEKVVLESNFRAGMSLLTFLNQKGQPLEQLHAFLRTFTQLLYPSENRVYNGPLAYYRQKEWRLIAGFQSPDGGIFEELSLPEKVKITSIDQEFFEKLLKGQKGEYKRVDACQKLKFKVVDEIRRLIIPSSAKEEFLNRFPGFPKQKLDTLDDA